MKITSGRAAFPQWQEKVLIMPYLGSSGFIRYIRPVGEQMRVTVLGCSGGIAADLRTTCLMVDDDILIDVGTGAGDLTVREMLQIESVFLTHSHLDHVAL